MKQACDGHLGSVKLDYQQYDFIVDYKRWVTADLIFANATAFTQEMLDKVSSCWENEGKRGSVFMITTKQFTHQDEEKF